MPTTKNPITLTFTVADDPSKPYVAVCEAADDDKQARLLRLNPPGWQQHHLQRLRVDHGRRRPCPRNNLMTRVISLALTGRPTRYAATV